MYLYIKDLRVPICRFWNVCQFVIDTNTLMWIVKIEVLIFCMHSLMKLSKNYKDL